VVFPGAVAYKPNPVAGNPAPRPAVSIDEDDMLPRNW